MTICYRRALKVRVFYTNFLLYHYFICMDIVHVFFANLSSSSLTEASSSKSRVKIVVQIRFFHIFATDFKCYEFFLLILTKSLSRKSLILTSHEKETVTSVCAIDRDDGQSPCGGCGFHQVLAQQ